MAELGKWVNSHSLRRGDGGKIGKNSRIEESESVRLSAKIHRLSEETMDVRSLAYNTEMAMCR